MRHTSIIILALFFVGTCISCKKMTTVSSTSLTGNWTWVRQTDSIRDNGELYDTLTPSNTGLTKLLMMNTDSTWSLAENGQMVQTGIFKLLPVYDPGGGRGYLLNFQINHVDSTVVYNIIHDSLSTSENIDDNGKSVIDVYVRH